MRWKPSLCLQMGQFPVFAVRVEVRARYGCCAQPRALNKLSGKCILQRQLVPWQAEEERHWEFQEPPLAGWDCQSKAERHGHLLLARGQAQDVLEH